MCRGESCTSEELCNWKTIIIIPPFLLPDLRGVHHCAGCSQSVDDRVGEEKQEGALQGAGKQDQDDSMAAPPARDAAPQYLGKS